MTTFSVVIIAKNEEAIIAKAVTSAFFADEVVVLDNYSTDATASIATNLGAVVYQSEWLGFGAQKNKAISLAKNNWVFVLDSDEVITRELQVEIQDTLKNPQFDGYFVARLNNFFGKNIRYCGLYPDYSIRLFDKTKGEFNDVSVHESVQMTRTAKLNNHMLHAAYNSIDEFMEKQKKYAKLSIKKPNKLKSIISPIWTFIRIYVVRLGFLEGKHGFIIAKTYAKYTFFKYNE